jgi:hypothetical protein
MTDDLDPVGGDPWPARPHNLPPGWTYTPPRGRSPYDGTLIGAALRPPSGRTIGAGTLIGNRSLKAEREMVTAILATHPEAQPAQLTLDA